MEKTIFEKIVAGEIPSFKVWENDNFYAFLDINPMAQGHTLVIPKENKGDYIFDLDDDVYSGLLEAARHVAKLLESKIECSRILMIVEGFDVPHVHIKLVPAPKNDFSIVGAEPIEGDMDELKRVLELIHRDE